MMYKHQSMIIRVSSLLLLTRHCHSSLFLTSPVASTTCVGGKPCLVSWIEDKSTSPDLSTYGIMTVGLYTGSQTQQTEVYKLTTLDPKSTSSVNVIIPPTVAANGSEYFFRMDSIKPPGGNLAAYQAFTARFTLSGMTGSSNSQTPIAGMRQVATSVNVTSTTPRYTSLPAGATNTQSVGSASLPTITASPFNSTSAKANTSSASAASRYTSTSTDFLKLSKVGCGLIITLGTLNYYLV